MAARIAASWATVDLMFDGDSEEESEFQKDVLSAVYVLTANAREDRMKTENYFEMTVPRYLPDEFARFFKISRGTFETLCNHLGLCEELHSRLFSGGRTPIPLQKKVLMTLRYLASNETVHNISDRFNVTDSSFLLCTDQVLSAINSTLLKKFIHWPKDNELPAVASHFNEMGTQTFPNIIGAIDGSHICIEAPLQEPNAFFNRKKFHSVILQAVCISDLSFTHINVGWPGRVHDAKVLKNSSLWDEGYSICRNGEYHIVGDGAYPIQQWLLTPYRDNGHLTRVESSYNKVLSSKRQVIERSFALLKGRFRRLKYIHCKSLEKVCAVICSTCIIHNICIIENDIDLLEEVILEEREEEHVPNDHSLESSAAGVTKRLDITNTFQ